MKRFWINSFYWKILPRFLDTDIRIQLSIYYYLVSLWIHLLCVRDKEFSKYPLVFISLYYLATFYFATWLIEALYTKIITNSHSSSSNNLSIKPWNKPLFWVIVVNVSIEIHIIIQMYTFVSPSWVGLGII